MRKTGFQTASERQKPRASPWDDTLYLMAEAV